MSVSLAQPQAGPPLFPRLYLPLFDTRETYRFSLGIGAVADLNDDGHLDAIFVLDERRYSGTPGLLDPFSGILVCLGRGDGTFEPPVRYAASHVPVAAVVEDFNRDGWPDLALAGSARDVSVLLGKGDGTFGPDIRFPISGRALDVASGDFNEDGIPDLVTGSNATPFMYLLAGRGDGTFDDARPIQVGQAVPVGDIAAGVAVADLDGDGHQDVAVSRLPRHGTETAIVVLRGDGRGGFDPPEPHLVGDLYPGFLQSGDVDLDGDPDLLFITWITPRLFLLENLGDARLAGPVSLGVATGAHWANPLAVIDFDRDGWPDIVTAGAIGDDVLVNYGSGQGGPGAPTVLVPGGGDNVAVRDFDEDGILDLLLSQRGQGEALFIRGEGPGRLIRPATYPVGERPRVVEISDLDGDGVEDLVILAHLDGILGVHVLPGTGAGFGEALRVAALDRQPDQMAIADLAWDSLPEIVIPSGAGLVLLGNRGGFVFEAGLVESPGIRAVAAGDLTGDGHADLAVVEDGDVVRILIGDGAGDFLPGDDLATQPATRLLRLTHLDEDPFLDLVLLAEGTCLRGEDNPAGTVAFRHGLGGGRFGEERQVPQAPVCPTGVEVADMDGDGRPDLVVMGESEPRRRNAVVILQGREGDFTRAGTWPVSSSNVIRADLRVADLDDDGCPDLATGATGGLSVLRGTGDGGLEPEERYHVGPESRSFVFVDVDLDGLPDLANLASVAGQVIVTTNLTPDVAMPPGLAVGQGRASRSRTEGAGLRSLCAARRRIRAARAGL